MPAIQAGTYLAAGTKLEPVLRADGTVAGLMNSAGVMTALPDMMTLISTAAAVSVTGTTSKTALRTVAIPDGAMGSNSRMIIRPIWNYTNSANNKVLDIDIGTTPGGATSIYNRTRTTSNSEFPLLEVANRNSLTSQLLSYSQSGTFGVAQGAATPTSTINFATLNMNIYVSGTLANTGETITLDSLYIDIVNPYQ